jgi:hypothetical protein
MDINLFAPFPPWEWPPAAAESILEALTSPDTKPSDRLLAAGLGGDLVVMNDDIARALMAIVGNGAEPEMLRARAAISFGAALEQCWIDEFDEPEMNPVTEPVYHRIRGLLHAVYSDQATSKEVRRRALEASVRAPDDWHADAIRQAYTSGDREWVLTAVFGMKWIDGFDAEIVESLQNPDPEIHEEAVGAAGDQEVDAAWDHLADLVSNRRTGKSLRLTAIEALSSVRPEDAGDVLEPLLVSKDKDIVEAAEEALSNAHMYANMGEDDDEDDFDEDEDEFDEDEDEFDEDDDEDEDEGEDEKDTGKKPN